MRAVEPIVRQPIGRPTVEQLATTATLLSSAKNFQQWQIDNGKVATGRSLNGWNILIRKQDNTLVTVGQLLNVPHAAFDLFGRPPGKAPTVETIMRWMLAKKVAPRMKRLRDSAFVIARAIGERGTIAPRLGASTATQIVSANSGNVIRKAAPLYAQQGADAFMPQVINSFDVANSTSSVEVVSSFKPSNNRYTLSQLLP
jgi:hypothetical protein